MKNQRSALTATILVTMACASTTTLAFTPSFLFAPPRAFVDPKGLSQLAAEKSETIAFNFNGNLTTTEATPEEPPSTVLEGISLPKDEFGVPTSLPNEHVQTQLKLFILTVGGNINAIIGTPKSFPLTIVQQTMNQLNEYTASFVEKHYLTPGEALQYKPFGNGEQVENLSYLLKSNPFFAMALTKSDHGGYAVVSFDSKKDSKFLNFTRTLNGAGHRVNVYFDKTLKYKSLEVFDDMTGKPLHVDLKNKTEVDHWASSAIYNVIFYASCVHATMHVFQYFMASAFQYTANTTEFIEMEGWADVYANNIQFKYNQVGTLLIMDNPNVPALAKIQGGIPAMAGTLLETYALLTGLDGFGSSQSSRALMKSMLKDWGSRLSAKDWLEAMMEIDYDDLVKDGILTEFDRQKKLIPDFAKDAAYALFKSDRSKMDKAETMLKEYLEDCNFDSKFETVEQWVQVMALTGIIHGCTLSYTRALADNKVLQWRNILDTNWNTADANLLFGAMGTIVGVEDGRHVFGVDFGKYKRFSPDLYEVLDDYNKQSTSYKENYLQKLLANREEFNNYGWILSDYAPDGVDGKQLTMNTYI